MVGKTWTLHVTDVLRTTLDENLRIIEKSLAYLGGPGAARHLRRRALLRRLPGRSRPTPSRPCEAAARGGAETLVLCDTNGGSLPWQIAEVVRAVKGSGGPARSASTPTTTARRAVANSLAAVREGAIQVQGTINGYGERCGNANLCSVIPALELKHGLRRACPPGRLPTLTEVSRFVAEVANLAPDDHLPYVGKSAFAHKGGIHVAAMRRNEATYQHIDPALVGNAHAGGGERALRARQPALQGRGVRARPAADVARRARARSRTLEAKGFSFEAAEASVAMMMKRQEPGYQPPFELIDFLVNVEHRTGRGIFAEAMVKVRVDGEVLHTAAEGDGPVDALDAALRKALAAALSARSPSMQLADYKVRILDGDRGTGAITRVLIDTHMGDRRWSTVGARTNIIEASWRALGDAVEYGLVARRPDAAGRGDDMKATIVVLPGDGIGPEVTAEAVRVLEAVAQRGRARASRSTSSSWAAAPSTRHGTALTDEVLAALPGRRRGAARRGGRPEVGRPEGQGAAGAGAARPAQGARRLRQPAPGPGAPGAGRRLAAQARPAGGRGHPGHPRADRRALLRRSPRGATARTATSAPWTRSSTRLRGAAGRRAGLPAGQGAPQEGDLGGQGQRARVLAPVAAGRHGGRAGATPTSRSSTCWWTPRRCGSSQAPASFDVLVTENMFGDILTDEAAVLAGSMGMLPSASLGAGGPGLYEPIHGSAPDIAGKGDRQPVGTILSAAMLLRHSLGLEPEAAAIERAVDAAITEGARTADLGGKLSTRDMADEVLRRL